jgi:type IV secretory pathway component VirB8
VSRAYAETVSAASAPRFMTAQRHCHLYDQRSSPVLRVKIQTRTGVVARAVSEQENNCRAVSIERDIVTAIVQDPLARETHNWIYIVAVE